MRAGLLSDTSVIRLINEHFISTWVLIDQLKQSGDRHPGFGQTLLENWEYPIDLMFLTGAGEFVSKLNSFQDFPNPHPDVGYHGNPFGRRGPSHEDIFFRHAQRFLDGE
ncbi:MAG: hypothetical protein ACKV0T_09350 [Planctomycetales bacterium]